MGPSYNKVLIQFTCYSYAGKNRFHKTQPTIFRPENCPIGEPFLSKGSRKCAENMNQEMIMTFIEFHYPKLFF